MTLDPSARDLSRKLSWLFTSPDSRYTLKEVVELTRCTRDDIQNWVRRDMVKPDATTPGRRIYSGATLATLAVAAELRMQGASANYALVDAHVITKTALEWFAGRELDDRGLEPGETPTFERDFQEHMMVFFRKPADPNREPSEPGTTLLPGVLTLSICHYKDVVNWFNRPMVQVLNLSGLWLELSMDAWDLKAPQLRRKGS